MRWITLLMIIPMLSISPANQASAGNPERAVRDALRPNSDYYGSGTMDKEMSRLGDAAAVAITKVVGGTALDTATIDRLLTIIQMAFAAPHIVENESDRQPRTALFVLKSMKHQTSDPKQQKQISDLIKKLQG